MTDEHAKRLEQTTHLFLRAPILNMQNDLAPMNDVMNDDTWGESIGFGLSPECILPMPKKKHCDAKLFQNYSFTTSDGKELPLFPVLTYDDRHKDAPSETPLPFFYHEFRCDSNKMLWTLNAARLRSF